VPQTRSPMMEGKEGEAVAGGSRIPPARDPQGRDPRQGRETSQRGGEVEDVPFQGEDEELGVVLVVEGGEGDGTILPRFQPVHLREGGQEEGREGGRGGRQKGRKVSGIDGGKSDIARHVPIRFPSISSLPLFLLPSLPPSPSKCR